MFPPIVQRSIDCPTLIDNDSNVFSGFLRVRLELIPGKLHAYATPAMRKKLSKWILKYVVLSRNCVYIYPKESSSSVSSAFTLYGYNFVTRAPDLTTNDHQHIFKLVHTHSHAVKTKYFSCACKKDMREWMINLRIALADANGKSLGASKDFDDNSSDYCFIEEALYDETEIQAHGQTLISPEIDGLDSEQREEILSLYRKTIAVGDADEKPEPPPLASMPSRSMNQFYDGHFPTNSIPRSIAPSPPTAVVQGHPKHGSLLPPNLSPTILGRPPANLPGAMDPQRAKLQPRPQDAGVVNRRRAPPPVPVDPCPSPTPTPAPRKSLTAISPAALQVPIEAYPYEDSSEEEDTRRETGILPPSRSPSIRRNASPPRGPARHHGQVPLPDLPPDDGKPPPDDYIDRGGNGTVSQLANMMEGLINPAETLKVQSVISPPPRPSRSGLDRNKSDYPSSSDDYYHLPVASPTAADFQAAVVEMRKELRDSRPPVPPKPIWAKNPEAENRPIDAILDEAKTSPLTHLAMWDETRTGSKAFLATLGVAGGYLVRNSSRHPGDLVLAVWYGGAVKQFLLSYQGDKLTLGDYSFNNLEDLLAHFTDHYLPALPLKLYMPFSGLT